MSAVNDPDRKILYADAFALLANVEAPENAFADAFE
jgi:hypothetical protein